MMGNVSTERRKDIADALEDMAERLGLAKGHRSILQSASAALRATPPAPERSKEEAGVKPLEWHADDDGLHLVSHTVAGRYAITEYPGMEQPFRLYCPTWMERKPFSTLGEAKAAAQADYETRIRSALSGDTL